MSIQILHGDMLALLPMLDADSIDSVVTDPPYHLTSNKRGGSGDASDNPNSPAGRSRVGAGFMGKQWDGGDIAFRPETWAEVFRVMKPGAHLVAFGGTRTFHRMACAIEDAGFEIRDTLCWLYGSGFPKSHDVSKGIDKAAGVEREVISAGKAVKRMIPGADQHSTGTWLKENGRVFTPTETSPGSPEAAEWSGWGTALKPAYEPIILARKPLGEKTVVANVLRHGTGAINIGGCRIELADGEPLNDGLTGDYERMDSGATEGSWGFKRVDRPAGLGRWPANVCHDGSDEVLAGFPQTTSGQPMLKMHTDPGRNVASGASLAGGTAYFHNGVGDSGSAARFFYAAKADKGDRLQSKHPTVKPVDLIRWLARLITPPGGTILDCFAGSGTTGMAALAEGFNAVLCEREAEYVADIRRRLAHVSGADAPLFAAQ